MRKFLISYTPINKYNNGITQHSLIELSKETGDNWLLAKKPVGMFHCASCDSFIGDLNSKNEFLPWNKIQPREENKYRMGHLY